MNFDYKSLACFKKVAELEHMTKAASELYISQAQLSRTIADLEEQFSVKFFDRVGKGIKLNACGREFYQYIQKMSAITETAVKKLQNIHLHEQFQLVAVSNTGTYLPGMAQKLMEMMPGVNFRQMNATRKKNLSLLREGIADFSICCPIPNDIDFEVLFLRKEPGVLIYPENHWLNGHERVSLSMLTEEKFIGVMRGYGARESAELTYEQYGFHPHFIVETTESGLIGDYVERGIGIAVVPRSVYVRNKTFKYRMCEIEEPVSGTIGLLWRKDRVLNEIDQVFIQTTADYFKSLGTL